MMTKEPYSRKQSDLTVPIDRSKLPPVSSSQVASLGLDPDHPETREILTQNQEGVGDRETLMRCPACAKCPCCLGERMVTPARAMAYEESLARVATLDEPDAE